MTLKVNKHSQALERAGMPADKNKFVSTLRDHLRTAILLVALPALQACDDFYAAGLALNSITEYKACVQECLRHKYAFDAAVDMSSLSEDEGLPPVPDLGIEETQKACVAACTPDNDLPDGGIPFADLGSDQSPAHADASLDASFDAGLDGSVDEGFDVPDAEIGILVSFTKTKRQTIQRDGRILRFVKGKMRSPETEETGV